jgi:hypothetical protein
MFYLPSRPLIHPRQVADQQMRITQARLGEISCSKTSNTANATGSRERRRTITWKVESPRSTSSLAPLTVIVPTVRG